MYGKPSFSRLEGTEAESRWTKLDAMQGTCMAGQKSLSTTLETPASCGFCERRLENYFRAKPTKVSPVALDA